jgi:hypothetical protein
MLLLWVRVGLLAGAGLTAGLAQVARGVQQKGGLLIHCPILLLLLLLVG